MCQFTWKCQNVKVRKISLTSSCLMPPKFQIGTSSHPNCRPYIKSHSNLSLQGSNLIVSFSFCNKFRDLLPATLFRWSVEVNAFKMLHVQRRKAGELGPSATSFSLNNIVSWYISAKPSPRCWPQSLAAEDAVSPFWPKQLELSDRSDSAWSAPQSCLIIWKVRVRIPRGTNDLRPNIVRFSLLIQCVKWES